MKAERRLEAAIRRTGERAVLLREGAEYPFPASIQPIPADDGEENALTGFGAPRRYRLYAPCGEYTDRLRAGERIACGGTCFRVLRATQVLLRGKPLYWRAHLKEETGGETDAG